MDEAYLDGACIVGDRAMETAARLGDNVVAINSMTKILGLAGLRVGWIIAEPQVVERARNVMDLVSVNNAAPSASLAVRAFLIDEGVRSTRIDVRALGNRFEGGPSERVDIVIANR